MLSIILFLLITLEKKNLLDIWSKKKSQHILFYMFVKGIHIKDLLYDICKNEKFLIKGFFFLSEVPYFYLNLKRPYSAVLSSTMDFNVICLQLLFFFTVNMM